MKKLIIILGFFLLTSIIYAKQFCVRISCYEDFGIFDMQVRVDISEKINAYLKKGYKLVSIMPEITGKIDSDTPIIDAYYCIFDDGVN